MSDSAAFRARAHRVIPGGAHTYSKGDDQLPLGAPAGFVRGKGARVWDIDGREFVDWGMGINNVLIGHAEEAIDTAAIAALLDGQNFSRPTPVEVETAEAIATLVPGLDMVKLAKNGSDVNDAALRLARAVTGRALIAYDADAPFLSTDDWFIGTTVMNAGVPEQASTLSVPFRYDDVASVERVFAEHGPRLAAVIMEPCRETRPRPGFLERVRALCDAHGTLLVFDEIVTAFRYHRRCASELLGVRPDLMTLGKGLANGYALAALVGPRALMERGGLTHTQPRCFLLSTTNGAERSALAAGRAALEFYRHHDVATHLAAVGRQLMDGLEASARQHGIEEHVTATGDFACRPIVRCLDADRRPAAEYRTLFLQELLRHHVFMPWVCPSYRHGRSEMDQTLEAFDAACAVYARAVEQRTVDGLLEGPPVRPVFRRLN